MKPATEFSKITKNLYGWSTFHTQWKIDFNSYALQTPDGLILIDPTKPEPSVIAQLEAVGEPVGIFLTNAHHDRDANWFRKHYEIQVYAHENAQHDCETKIDVLILDGEKLPGGIKALHLPGSNSSETALLVKSAGGIAMLGDLLLNLPDQGIVMLPDEYIEDRKQAVRSLRKLLELDFKIVTFAHGKPLLENAKRKIAQVLKKRR